MKRLMLYLAIVCLAFAGCEKDKIKTDDRLVGTKWYCSDFVTRLFYGSNAVDVYEFVDEHQVEEYVSDGTRVIHSEGSYEYTLDYPHLKISRKRDDGTDYSYTFKDSRTLVQDGDQSGTFIYLKQ